MDPQSERQRPYRTSGTDTPPYKHNWPTSDGAARISDIKNTGSESVVDE